MVATALAIAVLGGLAIWQLSDDSEGPATAPATAPEVADPLPELPPRWTKSANLAGGFALGVPPGWTEKRAGARTTLRSPGSAVVVAVTADRTGEALEEDLGEFAAGILERLEPGAEIRPVADPPGIDAPGYETAAAEAIDTAVPEAGPGVAGRKRLQVVVVRRTDLAAYPVLVASDAAVKRAELDPIVARIVRSIRGRPAG